jgi:hypothetical protein
MYGVERLKTTCEQILQKGLNVENAAGLLALADENRCVVFVCLGSGCSFLVLRRFGLAE